MTNNTKDYEGKVGIRSRVTKIDLAIAKKLKFYCATKGISAVKLSELLDGEPSGTQILKYINGQDRISAGKLFDISVALDVPLHNFFHVNDTERQVLKVLNKTDTKTIASITTRLVEISNTDQKGILKTMRKLVQIICDLQHKDNI